MPTLALERQKQFKLNIIDGLPQVALEIANGVHWVKCCPLCGCTHQVLGVDEDMPYTPLCQTLPVLYKTQQASWHKLHPGVSNYTMVHLVRETSE
jgi:hypothetical protein